MSGCLNLLKNHFRVIMWKLFTGFDFSPGLTSTFSLSEIIRINNRLTSQKWIKVGERITHLYFAL